MRELIGPLVLFQLQLSQMAGIWYEADAQLQLLRVIDKAIAWRWQACKNFVDEGRCVSRCPPVTVYSRETHTLRDNPHGKYMYGRQCVKKCPREYPTRYAASYTVSGKKMPQYSVHNFDSVLSYFWCDFLLYFLFLPYFIFQVLWTRLA